MNVQPTPNGRRKSHGCPSAPCTEATISPVSYADSQLLAMTLLAEQSPGIVHPSVSTKAAPVSRASALRSSATFAKPRASDSRVRGLSCRKLSSRNPICDGPKVRPQSLPVGEHSHPERQKFRAQGQDRSFGRGRAIWCKGSGQASTQMSRGGDPFSRSGAGREFPFVQEDPDAVVARQRPMIGGYS